MSQLYLSRHTYLARRRARVRPRTAATAAVAPSPVSAATGTTRPRPTTRGRRGRGAPPTAAARAAAGAAPGTAAGATAGPDKIMKKGGKESRKNLTLLDREGGHNDQFGHHPFLCPHNQPWVLSSSAANVRLTAPASKYPIH